jgi:outer membrane lipoprotein-sorting protein
MKKNPFSFERPTKGRARPRASILSTFLAVSLIYVAPSTAATEQDNTAASTRDIGKTAEDLLRRVDALYRSDTGYSRIRMQIVTPNWERTLEMESWTKGQEDTFIRILAPKKDRGVSTLKIGEEMWNYFPKIDKVIKVPPSMMMSSWMGSDFTNDDLVKESSLADDYDTSREDREGLIYLSLVPREQTVTVWGRIEVVVDAATLMPVEQSYYNERGENVRTMSFLDPRDFNGVNLPSRMEMVPHNKEGHKTVIFYDALDLNVELPEDVFTLRNLKRRFN